MDAEDLDARIEFALTGLERVRARRRQETETSDVEPTPDKASSWDKAPDCPARLRP